MALTISNLDGALPLVARGKVRDIYGIDDSHLLFVATDRISAFDVILKNGIPLKGKILTAMSVFWLQKFEGLCRNHLITTDLRSTAVSLPSNVAPFIDTQLAGRTMIVGRYEVFKIEAIVRGYLTGSSWAEYQKSGTVHSIKVREGMKESEAFDAPMYTPSTKAEQGEHDENIHPDQAEQIVGSRYAKRIEELAVTLYTKARDYALEHGIIIADTKFEFGLDKTTDEIVLIDEVLTPDNSRFWKKETYEIGQPQNSYDKDFIRKWLTTNNLKGKEDIDLPEDIVRKTTETYIEAYERLTLSKVNLA